MVTETIPDWRLELAEAIKDPLELLAHLEIAPHRVGFISNGDFPLRVPKSFMDRMERGNIQDPLLRKQVCDLR